MPEKTGTKKLFETSYIIGIGASAGGLDAINEMFENMPENTGFSFVIIQHISPDYKSLMAELVAKHTAMPVVEATDEMLVLPNHVYVIPSKKVMTLKFGKLHLQEKEKTKSPNNAIDVFFESLAEDAGEYAVGVILSGTGTDGTRGLEAIKNKGGFIAVQEPITAAFDGMPNSAIATGKADMIVSPERMGDELLEFLNEPPEIKAFHARSQKDELLLRDLLLLIKNRTGHDFGYYKRPTICRRLAKRLSELGIPEIRTYLAHIERHPEELSVISKDFLINVSGFFRDKEAFDIVATRVIPTIVKNKADDDTIKAWCVACSTGEEAYSLAILFKEALERSNRKNLIVKIFATDIDRDALEIASRGFYPKTISQDIPANRLARYFLPEENGYRIHPDIRKMVVFSYHDILKDPPFGRMDLVSCRNMLIYINPQQQKEIQRKLHFALNLDGYLFLGSSENIGIMNLVTEEIDRKWKIYKCTAKTRLEEYNAMLVPLEKRMIAHTQPRQKNPLNHIAELFNETLLEDHHFSGIFINTDFEVKQAIGSYKKFINFPDSSFNLNLLKMVDPDLSIVLSVAINKAMRENQPVITRGVKIGSKENLRSINVIIKPYLQMQEYQHSFLFIALEEDEKLETGKSAPASESFSTAQRVIELEQELQETRSNLQALLEEVETSNEELRSANEEAISTNEELQSTNEELQSLNEELHTVSAEHQLKIKELLELNDDLNNYFRNSDLGQILVDKHLIIRKFTPSVKPMINLIETDINRSLLDITTRIRNRDLIQDIRDVIHTGRTFEKEIVLNDNTVYLMRINPYLKQDHSIDGAVINFIDISEVTKLNSIVQAIFESSENAITAKKAIRNEKDEVIDFEYIAANKACEKLYGFPVTTIIGKRMRSFDELRKDHFALFRKVVETGESKQYEYYDDRLAKWLNMSIAKMMDGIVAIATDVTASKKAADLIAQHYEDLKVTSGKLEASNIQLEQSNLDLMQFASVASHDLKEPLRKIETFGNLLQAKLKDRFDDGEMKYLDKIIKSSHRMQALIEDVLTFSKLSNNELPLEKIDLNKIVNRIREDLEITIKEKNANIQLHPLPVVNAVKGQMHQLFQNLISNALKFNDKKQPHVIVSERNIPAYQSENLKINPEDYVCISVKDDGIGFEEKFTEKIFGIFQRLHGNQFEGTGIGLAICKKIIENHNGFLLAESVLQEGTEFFVILPRNPNGRG